MKIVLCCAEYTLNDNENSEYQKVIDSMEAYYLQIDSAAVLPIGAIVDVFDKKSSKAMQLKVVKHWYDHDYNILMLYVDVDGGEMSSQEFIDYLRRCWTTGQLMDLVEL